MTKSRVLKKLRAGDYARIAGISRVPDPWLAEVIGRIGYDVIWYDLEHREFGYETILPMSLACRYTGMDLMVRIRKHGYDSVMRALEFGANGIMVPHCRSVEEARQYAEWMRFPPRGKRGLDGAGADADWALADTMDHIRNANEETFLVLQIEDKEAVDCVDEIAAVDGVDILFVGPGDLSLSYGVPLQFDHPRLQEAVKKVADAARKHGKWWGTVTGSPEKGQNILDLGGRFITAGGDHGALLDHFQQSFAAFQSVAVKK
jgi:4-hydroxy-2-oxoheptanedioate aldolase